MMDVHSAVPSLRDPRLQMEVPGIRWDAARNRTVLRDGIVEGIYKAVVRVSFFLLFLLCPYKQHGSLSG